MRVDVYPVGVLHDLRLAWRILRNSGLRENRRAYPYIRNACRKVVRHVRRRMWRELKNDFNGFLAEPDPWPPGLTRCGSGWTRKRALRSLIRNARRPGVQWDELSRKVETMLGWRS